MKAVKQYGFLGFHFHPIMQHFAVDDPRFHPLFEEISSPGIDRQARGRLSEAEDRHGASRVAMGRHARPPAGPIMFGSDYPSMPYARILKEWQELGYKDEVMGKIFHQNAERILGL